MVAILIIEYTKPTTKPLSFFQSLLKGVTISSVAESAGRQVLYVHHAELQDESLTLLKIWTALREDLKQANWIRLSDSHLCVRGDSETGLIEYYSIPESQS